MDDLVHTKAFGLLLCLDIYVVGDADDKWLLSPLNIIWVIDLSDAFGHFKTIRGLEITLNENQLIFETFIKVEYPFDFGYRLFSAVGKLSDFVPVFDAENHEEAIDYVWVDLVVVYNQNFVGWVVALLTFCSAIDLVGRRDAVHAIHSHIFKTLI